MTTNDNIYKADIENIAKEKIFYSLAMFPYPSGAGLHVGHGMNFTANDIMARFKRMQGYTVINPIGWDSFGLPTENYAIKLGKPAGDVTEENIVNYKKQCELMDWSYDWDREIATSSSEYYKWTQWIFAQLYKAGLVYKKDAFVNRCPDCQTVLANDQVVDGHCERCNAEVIQKKHPQWFIKITDYAEKLIDGLDDVDWPEETKIQQKYWIGKSQGAEIDFQIDIQDKKNNDKITVFTTRPDTLFGVTAIVLAPENASIDAYIPAEYKKTLDEYRISTAKKTAIERQQDLEEKSGVFSGVYAIHPLTGGEVSVWFADYVLPDYATGAVMFVPAHDERDWAFAKKHNLEVEQVLDKKTSLSAENTNEDNADNFVFSMEERQSWYADKDDTMVLVNSSMFDGKSAPDAKKAIIEELEKQGVGRGKITYKLRDWSVSRQRYWGSPIPVYYTFEDLQYNAYNPDPDKSKWIPHLIPDDELPVILPLDLGNYKPAGKSPLADHPTFPYYQAKDGNTYLRECDTLDTFMCSSFYFLRFVDPHNTQELVRKDLAEKTMPVDFYIGGKEHTYGHLLYSRFVNRFLYDQGYITNPEPFQKLFHQGMVLGPDGRKMSKRWGNVITPGDLVEKYGRERGADVLRTYTMFMGPLELEKAWNDGAVDGVKRFLDRVERMQEFISDENNPQTQIQLHKTIKGVTEDIEKLKFNTAVSKLMIFVNHVYDVKIITKEQLAIFLQLLAPFATKLTQQLREKIGQQGNIHLSRRPIYDESLLAEDMFSLPVQINGKMRGNVEVPVGISQDDVVQLITTHEKFVHHFQGISIKKVIYVQDKIVNFIIG